jgi:hypothetical protein
MRVALLMSMCNIKLAEWGVDGGDRNRVIQMSKQSDEGRDSRELKGYKTVLERVIG